MIDAGENVVDAILQAHQPVVLLRGPAACGKTSAVLAFHRRYLDAAGRSACLLVAPNTPAVADLKRRLLTDSPAGLVIAPPVTTIVGLAGRIMAAAGQTSHVLPAFKRRLLLRQIVNQLRDAGELSALSAVADTPGIVATLDRAIAELKRAAVDPEVLAEAIHQLSQDDRSRDLWKIYRHYQAQLQAANAYDVDGQLWQARDCLAAAGQGDIGLGGVRALAIDGFTDFTPTQLQILNLLTGRVEKLVITLPFATDKRTRLWHWTTRTLNAIRQAFGDRLAEVELPAPPAPSLRATWDNIFDPDAQAGDLPTDVHLLSAAGLDAEVASAARKIKRLLIADAASSEKQSARITVLVRSLDEYGPAIARIFARHDIPVAAAPAALADQPVVRFLLDVASLAPEFSFQQVLRVIRSSYFQPQCLGDFGAQTSAIAEMLIRKGNVLSGAQTYHEAAVRLARVPGVIIDEDGQMEQEDIDLGPLSCTPQQIDQADRMLQKLFALSQQCADGFAGGQKADSSPTSESKEPSPDDPAGEPSREPTTLSSLIHKLDLYRAALRLGDQELLARDLRALAALEDVLASVGSQARQFTLDDIRQALTAAACPSARAEAVVDVMDVLDARSLRYDHVFLLGVSEGQFPRHFNETSMLTDSDRQAYASQGLRLDTRGDLLAREMLLMYLAISRSGRTLHISFLQSDASGQPSAPSNFLLSMLDAFGGFKSLQQAGRVEVIPPGQFVPPADDLASASDAFSAALAGLFDRRLNPAAAALAWARKHQPAKLAAVAMGLFARHRRYLRGDCDAFDGRISDPSLLEHLARRYSGDGPDGVVFSASQLNAYGLCPWHFFGQYVLRLSPLEEPQRQLQPVEAGIFCHNVMFRVVQLLRQKRPAPLQLAQVPTADLEAALKKAIDDEAAQVQAHRVPYPLLWQLQLGHLRASLWQYLQEERVRSAELATLHAELSFGMGPHAGQGIDPASRREPVELATPTGKLRLRGKIDRVDQMASAAANGLLVIDYKTGQLPSGGDIEAGRNLQLPLYSAAVEQLLGAACLGGAFHKIGQGDRRQVYFAAVKYSAAKGQYTPMKDFDAKRQAAMALAGRFVQSMRQGRFDLLPTGNCPSYCPLRQICQFSPARQELKSPPEPREDAHAQA